MTIHPSELATCPCGRTIYYCTCQRPTPPGGTGEALTDAATLVADWLDRDDVSENRAADEVRQRAAEVNALLVDRRVTERTWPCDNHAEPDTCLSTRTPEAETCVCCRRVAADRIVTAMTALATEGDLRERLADVRTPTSDTCPTACVEENHPGREHDDWLAQPTTDGGGAND